MDEPDVFTMLEEMRRDAKRTLRSILFVKNGVGFVFHDRNKDVIPPARLYKKFVDGVRAEWRRHVKRKAQ